MSMSFLTLVTPQVPSFFRQLAVARLITACIGLGSSSAVGPTIVEEVANIFLDTLYKA